MDSPSNKIFIPNDNKLELQLPQRLSLAVYKKNITDMIILYVLEKYTKVTFQQQLTYCKCILHTYFMTEMDILVFFQKFHLE